MKIPSGEINTVENVLFSPSIIKILISVGSIADRNLSLEFVAEGCFIRNRTDGQLLAKATRDRNNGLYRLDTTTLLSIPSHNGLHSSDLLGANSCRLAAQKITKLAYGMQN